MKFSLRRLVYLGALAMAFVVLGGTANPAEAALRLSLADAASNGVVITDQAAGDSNPTLGAVTFIGGIDSNFLVNVSTGISKPVLGSSSLSEMDLNSVNVASTGAGTITITLEDTDFTNGAGSIIGMIGGTLVAPAGSTITAQAWANAANAVPDMGADTFPAGPVVIGGIPAGSTAAFVPAFTAGPGAFSATASQSFSPSGPFSMFQQVTITFAGAGSASFDFSTQVVPEPATLAGAIAGMPFLASLAVIGRWRRRRKDNV